MPEPDPAAFYTGLVARIYRHLRGDEFDPEPYARFVARYGEPALELGCGDGDPILALRARGLDVEGLDASSDMLVRCQAAAAARALHVVLHQGTFETMDLGRRYRSIYFAGATFNLLTTDDAAQRTLDRIAMHLAEDGAAMIPLFVPEPLSMDDLGVAREHIEPDGTIMRVTPLSSIRDEPARTQTTVLGYELVEAGVIERAERPWVLHWFERDDLESMVAAAGLRVAAVRRFDGAPAAPDDTAVTIVARRR